MPVVLKKEISRATLIIWRITESEKALNALVTEKDVVAAEKFSNEKRRKACLAWRAALREYVPKKDIKYDEVGAPYVEGWNKRISVSHTEKIAVLLISPRRCGVDVERIDRDCTKTAKRFMSPVENLLFEGAVGCKSSIWAAKEAMYKYSGHKELDFIRDLKITSVDFTNCMFTGRVCGDPVDIRILHSEDYVIACII